MIWKKMVHFIIMCLVQNRCSTAEARLAAMKEQSESAKEEAAEWKRKYEAVAVETKEVIERTISQKDKAIKQAQLHEDTLRAEFTATVSRKVNDPFEREHVLGAHPHNFAATFFMTVGGNGMQAQACTLFTTTSQYILVLVVVVVGVVVLAMALQEEEAKDLQARIEQGERTIASLTAHLKVWCIFSSSSQMCG
jgi:hypothetical protein